MSLYTEFGPDKSDALEKFEGFKIAEVSDVLKNLDLPEEVRVRIVRSAIAKAIARVKERKENPKVEMNEHALAKTVFAESIAPHLPGVDNLEKSIQERVSGILVGIALAVQVCIELEPPKTSRQVFMAPRQTDTDFRGRALRGKARKRPKDNKRTA